MSFSNNNTKNHWFKNLFLNDSFILTIILINSFTIFGEGFKDLEPIVINLINIIDSFITILFVIEAIIKIREYSWHEYISSNWNKLDFILVIITFPSILLIFIHITDKNLHFLLILRILRVFKFFRFFKFIPGIEKLVVGVRRAIRTSVFVLMMFIIYNFIVSILSCFLFKDMSPEYFGNPLKSFYSTFKIFTVEGWYEIPDKMVHHIDNLEAFLIKLYFIIILITGGIFGLSLVNSIFVDAMVMDNNDELEIKVEVLNMKMEKLIELYENNLKENNNQKTT